MFTLLHITVKDAVVVRSDMIVKPCGDIIFITTTSFIQKETNKAVIVVKYSTLTVV